MCAPMHLKREVIPTQTCPKPNPPPCLPASQAEGHLGGQGFLGHQQVVEAGHRPGQLRATNCPGQISGRVSVERGSGGRTSLERQLVFKRWDSFPPKPSKQARCSSSPETANVEFPLEFATGDSSQRWVFAPPQTLPRLAGGLCETQTVGAIWGQGPVSRRTRSGRRPGRRRHGHCPGRGSLGPRWPRTTNAAIRPPPGGPGCPGSSHLWGAKEKKCNRKPGRICIPNSVVQNR